jgi:hypothetical protein
MAEADTAPVADLRRLTATEIYQTRPTLGPVYRLRISHRLHTWVVLPSPSCDHAADSASWSIPPARTMVVTPTGPWEGSDLWGLVKGR